MNTTNTKETTQEISLAQELRKIRLSLEKIERHLRPYQNPASRIQWTLARALVAISDSIDNAT